MTDLQISNALTTILPELDSLKIDYWLARGVLRNLYIRNKIGGSNSDLDFHIWREDGEKLKNKLFPVFAYKFPGLEIQEPEYKLAFYTPLNGKKRHDFYIDFMYLNPSGNYAYYERSDGKRYAPCAAFHQIEKYI